MPHDYKTLLNRIIQRSGIVLRWAVISTNRRQTIAEHQYLTAVLSHKICSIIGITSIEMRYRILLEAVFHDCLEVITGDLPAPFVLSLKKNHFVDYYDWVRNHLSQLELSNDLDLEDNGPPIIQDLYSEDRMNKLADAESDMDRIRGYIVGIADLLEALIFVDNECYDPQRDEILSDLRKAIKSKISSATQEHPKYKWAEILALSTSLGCRIERH